MAERDSLHAIAAADRLQLSETLDDQRLLHRRLTIFYGYFALLAALAAVAGRTRLFPLGFDPPAVAFLRNVQTAHAIVLALVFFAIWLLVREAHLLRALDVIATTATAATAAVALSAIPLVVTVDVSVVSFWL